MLSHWAFKSGWKNDLNTDFKWMRLPLKKQMSNKKLSIW